MRTYLECIPCIVRQALDSARLTTDDEVIQEQVLREVLRVASNMNLRQSPPVIGGHIHSAIRRLTGNGDPYRHIKRRSNHFALKLYPELKKRVEESDNPLETAVRLAIAGNIIDFAVRSQLDDSRVYEAIEHSLKAPLGSPAVEEFRDAIFKANDILYLADNAGEIVFDRLLIEQLPREKVTLVVKGSAVINDATMADALVAGLHVLVSVIENGSDAPGTILEMCSDSFRNRFDRADLIIAKGQGNYETLSDVPKDIFFLLKAKCPVIARDVGCKVGSIVLQRKRRSAVKADQGYGRAWGERS